MRMHARARMLGERLGHETRPDALAQGHLEKSNINIVDEMISIVQAQHAFEMNQKGVQAADEMMRQTNQLQRG